jgi:hypothetical protein
LVAATAEPSQFDAALATAFGQEAEAAPVEVAPVAKSKRASRPKPVTVFRTAEPDPAVRKRRAGGPEIELEASLVRQLEPVAAPAAAAEPESDGAGAEAGEVDAAAAVERSAETQAFRRTAMAELTALATDSDDLTPRRRR